jgi:phosphate-selective porin OprO/OprP
VSTRIVGIPIEVEKSHLHFGVSLAYRTADSRGFDEDGSTYYNRKLNYTAGLQTYLNSEKFLTAYIGPSGSDKYDQKDLASLKNGGAKDQFQFGFEVMDIYRNFRWQAEYVHTKVNRVINKNKILALEREENGGGLYPEKWEDISYKYGNMRSLNFYGYIVQAHYLIFGGDYKYQRNTATVRRITKEALELSARYNYTSLNDIDDGATYYNGKFYDKDGVNNSHAGGITSAITVSLNYIFNANVRFIVEYTNQTIDNYEAPNEYINIYQGRFQIFF